MKKTLWILLLAALAGVLAWTLTRPPVSANTGQKVLPDLRPESVEEITIRNKEESVTLLWKDGQWTVPARGDYPADGAKVLSLLQRAWDLRPVQIIAAAPGQLPQLQLAPPEGEPGTIATEISFLAAGKKPLGGLLLGKRQTRKGGAGNPGFSVGRYVMAAGTQGPVSLVSETFDDAAPSPALWLDPRFPALTDLASIQMVGTSEDRQWTLTRGEDGSWSFEDSKADPAKVFAALGTWSQPKFQDILPPDSPEATAFEPVERVILTRTNGEVITLHIGSSSGSMTPLRISVTPPTQPTNDQSTSSCPPYMEKTTYLFLNANVETLARSRDSLRPEPPQPETPGSN